MKTRFFLSFLCIILASCSTLLLEPAEPEEGCAQKTQRLLTKGTLSEEQIDTARIKYFVQTDHRVILLRHIVKKDSIFVQTFTPEDMATFRITPEEQEWANAYLVHLNELLK